VVIVLRVATIGLAGTSYNTAENFSIAQVIKAELDLEK